MSIAPTADATGLTLPYRLRLGVTGHRTLANPQAIAAAVHRLLDRLERVLAGGPVDLEWTIVSSLAKGADRIVAEAVLEHSPGVRHPELEVVAPLPLEEYRTDFDTETDRAEFEALLARRSASPTVLNAATRNPRDPDVRNRCYLDAGEAIVRACEILIAVWDGGPAKGEGGTGDVVAYAVARGRVVLWISSDDPAAEPRLLLAPPSWLPDWLRRGPYRARPVPERPKELSLGLHQLAAFLRDRMVAKEELREAVEREERRLREAARVAQLPVEHLRTVFDRITPYYVRADTLAEAYRTRHTRAIKTILYLAAVAVSAVAFQEVFRPEWHWLMAIEVLALVGILVAIGINRWQAWHEKWLHDRYLAEHMRTASHTVVLGEDPSGRAFGMADALPFYAGPKSWLPAAIRSIVRAASPVAPPAALFDPVNRFLAVAWLTDQSRWHADNADRKEGFHRWRRYVVVGLFVSTLTLALLHLAGVGHHAGECTFGSPGCWFTFLTIALPAWATAIHAVGKQLEYERVAARSHQMAQVLERLALSAKQARTIDELRDVVREATRVVGLENHEWSVLLSFAPPELVV